MDAQLRQDPFLAAHLERPAYTLAEDASGAGLDQAVERLRREAAFCQAKAPVADLGRVAELEGAGFRLVDTLITMDHPGGITAGAQASCTVRAAAQDDEDAVRRLAGTCFSRSRFHLDPRIPRSRADAFKADWAGNYFLGKRGDAMLVAEAGGQVMGFLQLLDKDDVRVIDLVAVARNLRGQGLGRALLAAGEATVPAPKGWLVGTQAANTASLRFYEGLGFRFQSALYVLHFHGDAKCA